MLSSMPKGEIVGKLDVFSLVSTCLSFDHSIFIIKLGCSFIWMNVCCVVSPVTRTNSYKLHMNVTEGEEFLTSWDIIEVVYIMYTKFQMLK